MARVTVEDCLEHVENRFQLVLLAARRARQLVKGRVNAVVDWGNDKATVVALREIATGQVDKALVDKVEDQAETVYPQETTEESVTAATE